MFMFRRITLVLRCMNFLKRLCPNPVASSTIQPLSTSKSFTDSNWNRSPSFHQLSPYPPTQIPHFYRQMMNVIECWWIIFHLIPFFCSNSPFRGDDGCITGCVWDLSQRTKGCRRVQQALEDPSISDAARSALALELKGKVRQCARSACGNYVLQKFIQVLSALAALAALVMG